ncbi:hypothetical protein GQ53DRAFT_835398 [Thozetella sp. PMI_491]|nr:hypothetical protein GQ53DRAFT_835398 [Thozetella sp. PMI_491]
MLAICAEYEASHETAVPQQPGILIIPRGLSHLDYLLGDTDAAEKSLLDFYVNSFCRRKVLIDTPENGYRRVILPMVAFSPALKHAVLAVSAFDRFSDNHHSLGVRHKFFALKLLREAVQALAKEHESGSLVTRSPGLLDGTLLAILTLCISDITTGSKKEWVTHLRGASSLISTSGSSAFHRETIFFARHYFFLRATLSSTVLDTESYFSERTTASVFQTLSSIVVEDDPERNKINYDVGCSEELVSIISDITAIAREKCRVRATESSSLDKQQELLEMATKIQCRLDQLEEVPTNETPESPRIAMFSQMYRLATNLYLRHAGFDAPITHHSIQKTTLPALLDLFLQLDVPEPALYPMWPLFIASCMVISEEDRRVVFDQFQKLRNVWAIGNIGVTEQAVHAIWKWKDLVNPGGPLKPVMTSRIGVGTCRGDMVRGPHLGLEWDEPLQRLGWRMSLT